jgi:hypothetical protein
MLALAGLALDFFDLCLVHCDNRVRKRHFTFGANRYNFGSGHLISSMGSHQLSYLALFPNMAILSQRLVKEEFKGGLTIIT